MALAAVDAEVASATDETWTDVLIEVDDSETLDAGAAEEREESRTARRTELLKVAENIVTIQ